MTHFANRFGFTHTARLEQTFRFHDKIAAASSEFVLRNPHQLTKQIKTRTTSDQPGLAINVRTDDAPDPVPQILAEIAAKGQASVLILSRYGFNQRKDLKGLTRNYPELHIDSMTVHKSKGLEADYVLVDNMTKGKHGFPSQIADDPVLDLVLSDSEKYEFAEERRLFYVALTRAKQRVYLITDLGSVSPFVREIVTDAKYEKSIVGEFASKSSSCPTCESGDIIPIHGPNGTFHGCNNFPICRYRGRTCPNCSRGYMAKTSTNGPSQCTACGLIASRCAKCSDGLMFLRPANKYGSEFFGCSNYKSQGCRYTEQIVIPNGLR